MPDVFLRRPEVLRRTTLSTSRLYALQRAGRFPKSIRLGGPGSQSVVWSEAEVNDWIEAEKEHHRANPLDWHAPNRRRKDGG